jgi:basic membrane protein A
MRLKPQGKIKVAFVHNGSVNDGGWTNSHSNGRLQLLKDNKNVEAVYVENVGDGADAERVINQLASQGNKIIFACSFGYMDSMVNVAKKYPDTFSCTAPVIRQLPTWAIISDVFTRLVI